MLYTEVNEKDEILGLMRKEDFQSGERIHRSSHLILLNSKGKMLIQKRSSSKKLYPNLYTFSVSGTVEDESYEECLHRETKEEIGLISLSEKFLFKFFSSDVHDTAFRALFIATSDGDIRPDSIEISAIEWVSMNFLREDLIANPERYTPPFVEGMKRYFKV